jgi:acyl carrier protein|tara:strand:+ start:1023 stop:1283 length:261 start_codon:yes stop_codon:yes gene_type:complete
MSKMVTEVEVFAKLQGIVANQLTIETETIKTTSSFATDLGADSLDVVELVMTFEEEFDIPIGDEVAGAMSTVQDAVSYITEIKNKQ